MTLYDQARDLARISDWLGRDGGAPINADEEGRRELARRGWEVKSGVLCAPSSGGDLVPMWPERALFGRVPEHRAFRDTAIKSLQPEYASLVARYLYEAARLRSPEAAFRQFEGFEQKALTEGTDTAGGMLVPASTSAEILARMAQVAVVRPNATIVPLASDLLRIPHAAAAAATAGALAAGGDSVFSSGFVGDVMGETPAFSDIGPVFSLFQVPVKKLRAVTKLGRDFVTDAATDVLAWLARNGGENLGLLEDREFIAGDGSALHARGILRAGASTTNVAGTTANTISNTTAAAGSAPKIKTLCYSLPSQYARGARWIARRATEGNVRSLIDGQSAFLFPEEEETTLLAKSIDNSAFVDADGTAGNNPLIFGDLSSYVVAQKTAFSVIVLRERFMDTDQLGFVLIDRVGGDLHNLDAIRLGVV